ncbi:hypothetical protein GGU10DRAFT_380849 [Lentinula aff. detonsa]|uniref:Uncharacterized protein n=1 Tax=Lentinula aff. detonsa TaxID=2804958 RepID=A0AA38KL19_9AGAR|nr:hypothetical protein GGU10DRAFT_380849 [Lentinula aff. detonsa]
MSFGSDPQDFVQYALSLPDNISNDSSHESKSFEPYTDSNSEIDSDASDMESNASNDALDTSEVASWDEIIRQADPRYCHQFLRHMMDYYTNPDPNVVIGSEYEPLDQEDFKSDLELPSFMGPDEMSSPQKLTSSQIAAQLRQMQEQLLAAQEEERMEVERTKRVAEEKARREAEEQKKRQEKEVAEKKRRIEEVKHAKAAKKKLEEAEKKRQEELAEARRGKAREVVPSKRILDDISDPSDPPYQEESMNNDSERDEEPKTLKKKKGQLQVLRPLGPPTHDASSENWTVVPRTSQTWVKSNPTVRESSQPLDFYKRIVGAIEHLQETMVDVAYELRQFRLQVGSWQDTMLAERSRRARTGEALEALEIERELVEFEEEEEDFEKEVRRQKEQAELEEEEEEEEEE